MTAPVKTGEPSTPVERVVRRTMCWIFVLGLGAFILLKVAQKKFKEEVNEPPLLLFVIAWSLLTPFTLIDSCCGFCCYESPKGEVPGEIRRRIETLERDAIMLMNLHPYALHERSRMHLLVHDTYTKRQEEVKSNAKRQIRFQQITSFLVPPPDGEVSYVRSLGLTLDKVLHTRQLSVIVSGMDIAQMVDGPFKQLAIQQLIREYTGVVEHTIERFAKLDASPKRPEQQTHPLFELDEIYDQAVGIMPDAQRGVPERITFRGEQGRG